MYISSVVPKTGLKQVSSHPERDDTVLLTLRSLRAETKCEPDFSEAHK